MVDRATSTLRFNRTVGLKDSWAKVETKEPVPTPAAKPEPKDDGKRKRKRKARAVVQAEKLAADPVLAERLDRYREQLGLTEKDATTLTSDRSLSDFFENAIQHSEHIQTMANWTNNAVQALVKESETKEIPFTPSQLAQLVTASRMAPSPARGRNGVCRNGRIGKEPRPPHR